VNLLLSCIGKRGYIADYLRPHLGPGEQIIGTSNTPWTPGFAQCDRGLLMPPIASDEYAPAVLDACRRDEIGGLLSFYDPDVVALSAHGQALAAIGVRAVLPSPTSAETAFDKWLTFLALRKAGLPVLDTVITLEEAYGKLKAGQFRFPLVVKPRRGFGGSNVFVARSPEQMEAFFGYAEDMLIQPFAEGEEYNIDALADLGGRVLNVVVWRKYLSRRGETEQAVTVEDAELTDLGVRLAKAVGCIGPMDVDFIRGPGGETAILDVNLRFGGGYPVSHLAGADFPGVILRLLRGLEAPPHIGTYQRGVCLLKGVSVMGGPTNSFMGWLSKDDSGAQAGDSPGLPLASRQARRA
jgi:carbamoyl-phosphate synthase large subunit